MYLKRTLICNFQFLYWLIILIKSFYSLSNFILTEITFEEITLVTLSRHKESNLRPFSIVMISVFLISGLTTFNATATTQCNKTGFSNAKSTSNTCIQAVAIKKPKIKSKPSKAEPVVSPFKRNNGFGISPKKCPKNSIC